MKVGNAKYGTQKKKYFKLKDGESTFRILPPIGDLADKGIWSVFYSVHYGYKNSKGQMRAFESPLVKDPKTKMITVRDAALERIDQLKAALEKAKKEGRQEVVEQLGKLVGNGATVKAQFNLDKNHYVNVIDTQGNIGILKLRHRAKLALDATIKSLREKGIDPLSVDNGRFFVFRRTGNGLDTSFQVEVKTESVEVPGMGVLQREVVHKITPDIISRLESEAAQLNKLFKKPTESEVERIVKEGARAVDEILDANTSDADQVEDDSEYDDSPAPVVAAPVQQAPVAATPAPVQTAPAAVAAPAQTVSMTTPSNGVKTTAQVVNEQSDADFLKSLGLG